MKNVFSQKSRLKSAISPLPVDVRHSEKSLPNPLSPKSDQHEISPCNINTLYNRVVMRVTDMITQGEFA